MWNPLSLITPTFGNPKKLELRPSLFVGAATGVIGFVLSGLSIPIGLLCASVGGFGFLWLGLRLIPLGYRALAVDMGQQRLDRYFEAGWKWYWPAPYGALLMIDCQNKNLDIDAKKVFTAENSAVEIKMSIAYNRGPSKDVKPFNNRGRPVKENIAEIAEALFQYVITEKAEEQMGQEAEDQLRSATAHIKLADVNKQKKELASDVMQGRNNRRSNAGDDSSDSNKDDMHEEITTGMCEEVKKFGVHVQSVQITEVILPKEVEDAAAQEEKEKAQKRAEAVERDGNLAAIDAYMERGMTAEQAGVYHQTERNKVTRTVQTVQGLDLAGLGGGLGTAIGAALSGKVNPSPPIPPKPSPRRRKKKAPANPPAKGGN